LLNAAELEASSLKALLI